MGKTRSLPADVRSAATWKEVTVHTMRKLFALALMALALAFVAVGCGKKAEETPAATETNTMDSTDSTAMGSMDSTSTMAADSTMAH